MGVYSYSVYKSTAPGDYTTLTRTLTFNPSNTRQVITVNIVDDRADEPTEEFLAMLSTEETTDVVQLLPSQATVDIQDDDG